MLNYIKASLMGEHLYQQDVRVDSGVVRSGLFASKGWIEGLKTDHERTLIAAQVLQAAEIDPRVAYVQLSSGDRHWRAEYGEMGYNVRACAAFDIDGVNELVEDVREISEDPTFFADCWVRDCSVFAELCDDLPFVYTDADNPVVSVAKARLWAQASDLEVMARIHTKLDLE